MDELQRFSTDEEAGFVDDQKNNEPPYDYSVNDQKNIEEIKQREKLSLKQKEQWREYVWNNLDHPERIEDHRAVIEDIKHPLEKEEVTSPNHYSDRKSEPLDYIIANELDFLEGNIIKYITRYTYKGGVNDLLKARTYLEKLIEREVGRE